MKSIPLSAPDFLVKKGKLLPFIILLIPFILYFNTLFNRYALDDSIVITDNVFVKKGFAGIKDIFTTDTFTGFFKKKKDLVQGGRYRPLSVGTFAVEYAFWGLKPGISHLINILIYSLLCLILFKTLQQILLFIGSDQKSVPVAFLATLIYATHPVHTEVVANLKGRDELLAVLFLLLSLLFFIRYIETSSYKTAIMAGIMLFIALLSKENALIVIPIAILLLLMKNSKIPLGRALLGLTILLIATLTYIGIRFNVIGGFSGIESTELMNNPFLHAGHQQKTPTVLYTLLVYIKLLISPHPLTYDYYPYHITLHAWNDLWVLLSLNLHLLLLILGLLSIKNNRILTFGILFYFITLLPVSNLLVNIGSFMNERFLFLPSIGFALLAGSFFLWLYSFSGKRWMANISTGFLLVVLFAFSIKTITRNTQWKDNYTLFTHDVKISKNSAKGNLTAGGALLEKAQVTSNQAEKEQMLSLSIVYLNKSLSIYPQYVDALLLLGNAHYELNKNIPEVLVQYKKLFSLSPGHELAISNLKKMLAATENPDYRKTGYKYLLNMIPNDFDVNYQLGVTYGKMLGQLDSSKIFLRQALIVRPESKIVNRDLGVAYAISRQYAESQPYFEKVLQLDPEDPDNYINLGITYQNLGRTTDAKALFEKAGELKKSNK